MLSDMQVDSLRQWADFYEREAEAAASATEQSECARRAAEYRLGVAGEPLVTDWLK